MVSYMVKYEIMAFFVSRDRGFDSKESIATSTTINPTPRL